MHACVPVAERFVIAERALSALHLFDQISDQLHPLTPVAQRCHLAPAVALREFSDNHLKLQQHIRAFELARVREDVLSFYRIDLATRSWKSEIPRHAFAPLARELAIATLSAIGEVLDLTPSGVSRMLTRATDLRRSSQAFRDDLAELQLANHSSENQGLAPKERTKARGRPTSIVRQVSEARPRPSFSGDDNAAAPP
jgi:hypothetical protein